MQNEKNSDFLCIFAARINLTLAIYEKSVVTDGLYDGRLLRTGAE